MKILGLRDIESLAQGPVEEPGFEPELPESSSTTSSLSSPVVIGKIRVLRSVGRGLAALPGRGLAELGPPLERRLGICIYGAWVRCPTPRGLSF